MKLLVFVLLVLSNVVCAENGQRPIRVYADMVADLFHYGHVSFLKQAKEEGDYLIVGVHSDECVAAYKRQPVLSMDERVKSVCGCRYVDEVIPNAPTTITKEWLEKYQIDVVVHGDDIADEFVALFYSVPYELGKFKLLPYTPEVSTSDIIRRITSRADLHDWIDKNQ